MNGTEPLTQTELVEVMEHYVQPFYQLVGGTLALITILAAVLLVFSGAKLLARRLTL